MWSYMAYTPAVAPAGCNCWVRGVYFDRREYTAESGVYILAISGWVSVYSSTAKFATAAHRNINLFLRTIFPQSSLGEPLPTRAPPLPRTVFSTYCTSYPGTTAKVSHKFSWLFVQQHSAYLVSWTMHRHGWTDACLCNNSKINGFYLCTHSHGTNKKQPYCSSERLHSQQCNMALSLHLLHSGDGLT